MINPLTSLKEAALQTAIKAYINQEIADFGVVTELAIDTSKRAMRAELELKGETSHIVISVEEYELSDQGDGVQLALRRVSASREWITAALRKYVAGRTFRLPDAARMLL
ncbi:MAG TPA: hypothetical protein P5205_16685 [Candidatus Paceibacterota bacterium]|nr:hypothetical protein [Verrucomicrobiota bacterium]HSA12000.1 hypothetical protein [Candidatus Paceibacterota bacterium]